jgi:hypothetical protein
MYPGLGHVSCSRLWTRRLKPIASWHVKQAEEDVSQAAQRTYPLIPDAPAHAARCLHHVTRLGEPQEHEIPNRPAATIPRFAPSGSYRF